MSVSIKAFFSQGICVHCTAEHSSYSEVSFFYNVYILARLVNAAGYQVAGEYMYFLIIDFSKFLNYSQCSAA